MDVIQHGAKHPSNQPEANNTNRTGSTAMPTGSPTSKKSKKTALLSIRSLTGVLFFGVLVILVALIAYIVNETNTQESSYIDSSDYQAVFVNVTGSSGGQAYFGHIESINSKYVVLNDVFYLEPGASSNQFTLNNLSCALYNPNDQMVINRDQVAFWENLKSNSQVTADIGKWNTDKLTCASTAGSTTGSTGTTNDTTTK